MSKKENKLSTYLEELKTQLNNSNFTIKVYIKNEERSESKIDNNQLALIHNLGSMTMNIPARPFMTAEVFDYYKGDINKKISSNLLTESLSKTLGDYLVSLVHKQFTTNGEATGGWKPVKITQNNTHILQRTYQLRNSIGYKIINK